MKLRFHIIYLPNTFRYLSPLVHSLLFWSNWEFCLVANGCKEKELRLIKHFCNQEGRLSFIHLPFDQIVSHGTALNYLQQHTTEDYFCFMDSDIFATGPFTEPFELAIKNHQGVFSGTPLWCKKEDGIVKNEYPRIYGRHHHTEDGLCIGGTYFAIYNNSAINKIQQAKEIGFSKRNIQTIKEKEKQIAKEFNLNKIFFDTGKILNLCLLRDGNKLQYLESKHLHHLGGFSRFAKINTKSLKEKIRERMNILKKGRWHTFLIQLPYFLSFEKVIPPNWFVKKSILLRQILVEKYFTQIILTLVDHHSNPKWIQSKDEELDNKISLVTNRLIQVYKNQLVKTSPK